MDLNKIFGSILTVLGTGGLILAAISFINTSGDYKAPIAYGILGLIFFVTGIILIRKVY